MSDFRVLNNAQPNFPAANSTGSGGKKDGAFGNVLKNAIDEVSSVEKGSQDELQKFLSQESDLHTVMLAMEKADLSFQMMMQVRNKIVQAYQEIMRMPV